LIKSSRLISSQINFKFTKPLKENINQFDNNKTINCININNFKKIRNPLLVESK